MSHSRSCDISIYLNSRRSRTSSRAQNRGRFSFMKSFMVDGELGCFAVVLGSILLSHDCLARLLFFANGFSDLPMVWTFLIAFRVCFCAPPMILLGLGRPNEVSRTLAPLLKGVILSKFGVDVLFENGHRPVSGFAPRTVELLRKKQMRLHNNNRYMSMPLKLVLLARLEQPTVRVEAFGGTLSKPCRSVQVNSDFVSSRRCLDFSYQLSLFAPKTEAVHLNARSAK